MPVMFNPSQPRESPMPLDKDALYSLIRKTQSERDRYFHDMVEARAQLFDLLHPEKHNTPNHELKALVVAQDKQLSELTKKMVRLEDDASRMRAELKALRTPRTCNER